MLHTAEDGKRNKHNQYEYTCFACDTIVYLPGIRSICKSGGEKVNQFFVLGGEEYLIILL